MSISLSSFSAANRLAFLQKKMNAQRVHIGNQHSFFFTFCQFFFCLIRLLFLFKLHFAFHSPRNVLFLDTFSHVCLCVYMFVWRNFALSTLADFCAAFSLRTSLFFCSTPFGLFRVFHTLLDLLFLCSLFLRYWLFFLCSVALPWWNKKKLYIFRIHRLLHLILLSPRSLSFFRKLFFRLLFLSLARSLTHYPPLPTLLI